ncbi:MAG: antitoxin [Steroidobacteraceae bacterium]
MDPLRRVRIFKNGRNQAIRIPRELELDAREATIHKEGNRLVIAPLERTALLELLATWRPLEVRFPDFPDAPPEPVEL